MSTLYPTKSLGVLLDGREAPFGTEAGGAGVAAAFPVPGGERLREEPHRALDVEALRAGSGEAIWSKTFDRAADSLLGIEEVVATEVAAGGAGRPSPLEQVALGSRVTANSRAYVEFVHANVLLARRTPASRQNDPARIGQAP